MSTRLARHAELYIDEDFPHSCDSVWSTSKGSPVPKMQQQLTWRRLPDIAAEEGWPCNLFSRAVAPGELHQGHVGDCWLLSALACLAARPEALRQCFMQSKVSRIGMYTVRLYHPTRRAWLHLKLDDWVPCDMVTGRPLFASAADGAFWVPLLEKAMAKLQGSYSALNGGNTAWALLILTGNECFKFRYDKAAAKWRRHELVGKSKRPGGEFKLARGEQHIDSNSMFRLLARHCHSRSLVAASTGKSEAARQAGAGVVVGHAYTIIQIREISGFRLLQLWNPWGRVEWAGKWAPGSSAWQANPEVAGELLPQPSGAQAPGLFWMSWADFSKHFHSLDFCGSQAAEDFHAGRSQPQPARPKTSLPSFAAMDQRMPSQATHRGRCFTCLSPPVIRA